MEGQYLAALDQGTTSSRAIIFTPKGRLLASAAFEFAQHYPFPGWVEHEPEDLVTSTVKALRETVARAGIKPSQIAAAGIANQRETTLLWDRETGKPVCRAIVWQCRRTAPIIQRLKDEGLSPLIQERTGLVPDAYFSASKLRWLLDETGLQRKAEEGRFCFGTVDSYLSFRLVKGHPHVTDATNASRTMLFNLKAQDWDDDLLRIFNIPRAVLPRVVDSASVIGSLDPDILGAPVPVAALAGDQHAALFGQACFTPGDVKNTYGTGCFMLMNTGDVPVSNDKGLLSTMAWRVGGKPVFALEGSVFVAGAAIQWLRDGMKLIYDAKDSEYFATRVEDSLGVYVVPAFVGLGAPYWDMYARGAILGLTRGTTRNHIIRATLESIAYQTRDVLELMRNECGLDLCELRVDGGACANNFLMQFQSDILGVPVERPEIIETTAMGAAYLAGLATGFWKDQSTITRRRNVDRRFNPAMDDDKRHTLYNNWKKAVKRAMKWEEEE